MWPFKKKAQSAKDLPIARPWTVAEGEYKGKPMFVRINDGYRRFMVIPGYGHQVGIAVPLNEPEPSGLPSSAENGELDLIEDAICNALETAKESLFVAVITTSGMREFVFYTQAPAQVKLKFEQLKAGIASHPIQLMIRPDEDWDVYARLT